LNPNNKNKLTHKKFSKVLVAIDGSKESMDAAEYAISIAKSFNSQLFAIHILSSKAGYDYSIHPLLYSMPATPATIENILEVARKEAQCWLESIKQKVNEYQIPFFKEEVILQTTTIGGEIVDFAERNNIDLIVIGTKGRTGFKKVLLGSVASGVVTYAHCPVLVVR
jgi:nucleotide-binding universal stress UspA family protein